MRKIIGEKNGITIEYNGFQVISLSGAYVVETKDFYELYTRNNDYISSIFKMGTEYIPFEKAVNDANE